MGLYKIVGLYNGQGGSGQCLCGHIEADSRAARSAQGINIDPLKLQSYFKSVARCFDGNFLALVKELYRLRISTEMAEPNFPVIILKPSRTR